MFRRRFVVLAIVASLAACGGGGGGGSAVQAPSTTAPTSGPSTLPAGYAQAAFTITIPSSSSSSASARARRTAAGTRRPKTVPAGTQSITFMLLKSSNAGATTGVTSPVFALVQGAPGCTGGGESGPLSCTLHLQAPIGEDIYLASVYSNPNGTGYNGSGATYINVQDNTVNTASLTLSGTVATVYLSTSGSFSSENVGGATVEAACLTLVSGVPQSDCVSGTGGTIPASVRIFVVGLDSSGNQIITPDTFGSAVVLTVAWNAVDYAGMLRRHSAAQRRPLDGTPSPTPTPNSEPNPEDVVQLTDTPTSGSATSTSAGNPTLTVTSPSDQVTATAIGTTAVTFDLQVTATVNGAPQSSLVALQTYQNACVPDYGTPPFSCTEGPPGPTPTPVPLSWGNEPGGYDGFVATGNGNATVQAGWDPNFSFTPYTFEVDESGATSGDLISVNAAACDGALVEVVPNGAPSPSPSPTGTTPPTPSPSSFTATSNSSNPGFTFYVPVAPQPTSCPVTASDGVGDQVTLTFDFTETSITVQKHARQSLGKGTHQ